MGVPIGTARDITLRALDILASVDVLVAEDTRSLRRLMDIHGVPLDSRKLVALHDHSSVGVIDVLLKAVQDGKSVAYASEAGMPLIADPGYELSKAMHAADLPVTCAPGPSAVSTALVLGGLPTDSFHFVGFLPNTSTARRKALSALKEIRSTLVFYEAPKRLGAMLTDSSQVLGADRSAAVCRELTKRFEEVRRGTLAHLADTYANAAPKGEIVVLIDRGHLEKISDSQVKDELLKVMSDHSLRDAVDLVANANGLPRRQVYKLAIGVSKDAE